MKRLLRSLADYGLEPELLQTVVILLQIVARWHRYSSGSCFTLSDSKHICVCK